MPEEPAYIIQETDEINVIFIHRSLDDLGLTANQFRLYAHLARRANNTGKAWPGIDSMSEVCRMHKETVISSINELESRGMLIVEKIKGKKNVYRLTSPSKWRVVGNGERSEMGNGVVENGERHQSEMGNVRITNKGNPKKEANVEFELPLELSEADGFPEVWKNWIAYRKQSKKKMTQMVVDAQLKLLCKMGAEKAIKSIDNSITNGWTGLFEINETNKGTPRNGDHKPNQNLNARRAGQYAGVGRVL